MASKHITIVKKQGFTIVELLLVIVVIGVLATITIISYSGITNKAYISVMQSDLSNASKILKLYKAAYDSYPTSLSENPNYCPTAPNNDNSMCLHASASNTYSYTSDGASFNLIETNPNGLVYNVTDSTSITAYVDPWVDWYPGVAATLLAGKHVYKTDLGSAYQYQTSPAGVGSPQGATGLDPNYPTRNSLVSPQDNPTVDFSTFPAQNACKAIGGRLPNTQELSAIYTNRTSYGNNLTYIHWSSTYYYGGNAFVVNFDDGSILNLSVTGSRAVRCMAD